MILTLNFSHLVEYDTNLLGITLHVSLKVSDRFVNLPVKIDTGSSECVFAGNIAKELGIDLESGQVIYISTATGTFKTYRHPVTLSVLNYEFDIYAYFSEDEYFSRNVLGRHGFLDRIVLGLVDYEGKLFLNHYNDSAFE